jgi:hypothetical protein
MNTANTPFNNGNSPTGQFGAQPNGQFASGTNTAAGFPTTAANTSLSSNPMGNGQNTGSNNQGGRTQTGASGPTEPQPWVPLIAAVLTLAGSLAANLYLGASYLDARQKYQSLVRKTADTFRRVKAVAA